MDLEPREDIWVQDRPGQPARRLANGDTDQSKWWNPLWSPTGRWLAFVSTRGGNITLWVWERETNKVRQLSTRGVSLNDSIGRFKNFVWINDRQILFLSPSEGKIVRPGLDITDGIVRAAEAGWERARSGQLTANEINSNEFNFPKRALYLVDVPSGQEKRIATTLERHNFYPDFWPSPDGKFVALVSAVSTSYNVAVSSRMGLPHTLEIRTIEGEMVRLDKPLPDNIHTQTIKWSPDGKELAFFANGAGPINPVLLFGVAAAEVMPADEKKAPLENPARLYRVNTEKKTIEQIETGDIDLGLLGTPDFLWTASGELIFNAPKRKYGRVQVQPPERGAQWGWGSSADAKVVSSRPPTEWFVLDREGKTRPLSPTLPRPLDQTWSVNGGSELLGLADGELISINPTTGMVRNLTDGFSPRVVRFNQPNDRDALIQPNVFPPSVARVALTTVGSNGLTASYSLDMQTGTTKQLASPNPEALLAAYSPESGNVAYTSSTSKGLYLWLVDSAGKVDQQVEANTYLREIAAPVKRVIEYKSVNGPMLKGLVTFPIGYKPGRKYPVYVQVYPNTFETRPIGEVAPVSPIDANNINATAGFITLEPSEPSDLPGMSSRDVGGEEGDSCIMVANGVLPAVDKLVEMGIADSDRVFIWGASWGGWMVQCMVTQTTRFTAAIAQASGPKEPRANILKRSIYYRYTDNPANFVSPISIHHHINPSGEPWWRDGDRWRRNDPMSYVDRVQTPIMLIHGDLDAVPIDTSEDFFNALVSMRKTAKFVRYWGESHSITGEANARDRQMRIFAWCDRWGDISRDEHGNMLWDGDRVRGRKGSPPLKPEDYAKFDLFQPSPARQAYGSANGQRSSK